MTATATRGGEPIRFRIAYRHPERLLGEFTRSVHRGNVTLLALRSVKAGTRFIFELTTEGVSAPVEVEGEVLAVRPAEDGRFRLSVSYRISNRGGLDEVIYLILDAQRQEKARGAPRVPVNLRATEEAPYSPAYLIRDLSLSGVGVEIEAPQLPKGVSVGSPALMQFSLKGGDILRLKGVVVWTVNASERGPIHSSFGVAFAQGLDFESLDMLDRILSLKTTPFSARITFGAQALDERR